MSNEATRADTQDLDNAAPEGEPAAFDEAAAGEEIARLKNEVLRALAEAENVRKRGERAVQDARVFAIDRFARDLLDVADNLSRALATMPETEEEPIRTMREGVAMTESQLLSVLERHGVRRIGAPGEKFDPNVHQAIATIPSTHAAGLVADVLQAGYMLQERTLRAAMVAVSAGAPAEPAPPADKGGDEEPGARVDIKV
jgi:molecular chaperone GrpE